MAAVQQAQSSLATLPSLINDFVEQFSAFEHIWSSISKMLESIISELERGIESESIVQMKQIGRELGEQWAEISYLMDLYVANLI